MVVLSMLTAIVVAFIAPPAKIGGIVASRPSAAVVAPVMIAGIKQPFVYEGTSSVNAWAPYDYRGTYRPYYPMAYNSYGNYGYGGNYYSPYSYGRYGMGYGMGGYGGYGMGNYYSPYSYGRYGGYGGYMSPRFDTASRMGLARQYSY
jgi:hypothetical protein